MLSNEEGIGNLCAIFNRRSEEKIVLKHLVKLVDRLVRNWRKRIFEEKLGNVLFKSINLSL